MNWLQQRISHSEAIQNDVYNSGINRLEVIARKDKEVWVKNDPQPKVEFMSCSYLGLECDHRLAAASKEAIDRYGVQFASARTRINPEPSYRCDESLTEVFGAPTISFVTCGLVHLAILPLLGSKTVPGFPISTKGVYWILDKSAHASMQILRALMQQFGELERVQFSDLSQVQKAFETASKLGMTPISVSDGIGSMGGNAPVKELIELANTHAGYCYLDDAHGTSIMGNNGGGFVINELGNRLHPRVLLVSSLAKAFGATGGAMTVAHEDAAEFIARHANPYIFGGPLSLASVAAIIESSKIHLSPEIYDLQRTLNRNIQHFDSLELPIDVINQHQAIPIRGLLIRNEQLAIELGRFLFDHGFALTCATFPTVERGQAMLRLALSALHTEQQIESLVGLTLEFLDRKTALRTIN